ncbi:MAG: hypothetical protein M3145_08385, partial [Pseudomonadota bacterium]|nr:hypothetical protein [Pseudomonadota bacterium]
MSGLAECEVIGRWRIVEADLWDRDYLVLLEPAAIIIGAKLNASLLQRPARYCKIKGTGSRCRAAAPLLVRRTSG